MSQYNKIKWIQLIPILILSIFSLFLWAIYQVSNNYLTLFLCFICSIFAIYCIWKSEIPHNFNIYILNEWKDIKQLERAPQIFLACCFIYISSIVIYIFATQNYKLIILLYVFPMYAMPLLAKVVPSARQYQKIDIYFKKVFAENEEVSFFYIITLLATAWIGIIWGTDIITESAESNNRITITIQSITSSLAPLAFYIAWKNYIRKSGVHLLISNIQIDALHPVYPMHLSNLTIFNEKDRAIGILQLFIIFDNKYQLQLNCNNLSIKAYDFEKIYFDPVSDYTERTFTKYDPLNLFNTEKKILIQTIYGWYESELFTVPEVSIQVNRKVIKHPNLTRIDTTPYAPLCKTSKGESIQILLPTENYSRIIALESESDEYLWIYFYQGVGSDYAGVYKAFFDHKTQRYIIKNYQLWEYPYKGLLDRLEYMHSFTKNRLETYIEKLKIKEKIDLNTIHIFTK